MLRYLRGQPGCLTKAELLNGNRNGRKGKLEDLILLARQKLAYLLNVGGPWNEILELTKLIAVLDVRLQFCFEVGRLSALGYEQDLVSSHMRTAHSIVKTRAYMRSSFPSEPILAEAAAQQLNVWREQKIGQIDPAFYIVSAAVENDLVSQGELGEISARLLLLTARDRATVVENGGKAPENFSKPVSVITFLEALFAPKVVEEILNQQGFSGTSFRDEFKNSVINFTHFGRWGPHTNMDVKASFSCFVRQAGIMCKLNFPFIDFAIPVLSDRNKPMSPENMTVIFFQVKRCVTKTPLNKLAVIPTKFPCGKDVKYHPDQSQYRKGKTEYSYFERPCSFITITMELGVSVDHDEKVVKIRRQRVKAPRGRQQNQARRLKRRRPNTTSSATDSAMEIDDGNKLAEFNSRADNSKTEIKTESESESQIETKPKEAGDHDHPAIFRTNDAGEDDEENIDSNVISNADTTSFDAETYEEPTQFEVYVYGCNRRAYSAIMSDADEQELNHILGLDELYANHPNQSEAILQAVARQLPYLESTTLHAAHDNLGSAKKLRRDGNKITSQTVVIKTPDDPPLRLLN
jgi:hypothetical protein